MKRGKYQKVALRDEEILPFIRMIKADHPFWGYRRVAACLRYDYKLQYNWKRIYRIMKEHNLLVSKNTKLKALRTPSRPKPHPDKPNQWWGIDMTKVKTPAGWIYIVICIDWYTKKIVGYEAGVQSKTWHWLKAVSMAVNSQFPDGVRGHGLHLMSDNGCQPTSHSFMKECEAMGIQQAFTSYNNPKGNADTERFMRTMKEELLWINEWLSSAKLMEELDEWISWYNTRYLHSTLDYRTPCEFEAAYYETRQNTLLISA